MRIVDWIKNKLFWLKTGAKIEVENSGKPIEEVVIRYKDLYFIIVLDDETGIPINGTPFSWASSPMTHVPIREFYIAKREEK